MLSTMRWVAVGGITAGLAVWFLAVTTTSQAADDEKQLRSDIDKLADVMAKKDLATAKTQGEAVAKKVDDVEPVMDLMKPRKDGGYGVGAQAGKIMPDGIEKKLIDMGKKPPTAAQVNEQADALVQLANRVAAIAEVAQHKSPVKKKEGDKDPKDWKTWSTDMRTAALDLAAAAKAKNAADVKKQVNKLNESCNSCHSVFK